METQRVKADVGVIVGRFQVPKLHAAHMDLISTVVKFHKRVIIMLGTPPVPGMRRNPLTFEAREQMLRSEFPSVTILPISDHKSDHRWSENLDAMIRSTLQHHETAVIYGSRDSFVDHYFGKLPVQMLTPSVALSGSDIREDARVGARATEDFRAGVIHGAYARYPTCFPTVDIAVLDKEHKKVVLIKNLGNDLWKLPGGFVDPADKSLEAAALREACEEVGHCEYSPMQYMGSFSVPDWRYRNEPDCIKTTLFWTERLWGPIQAGDDAVEAKWFDIDNIFAIDPTHNDLIEAVVAKFGTKNPK